MNLTPDQYLNLINQITSLKQQNQRYKYDNITLSTQIQKQKRILHSSSQPNIFPPNHSTPDTQFIRRRRNNSEYEQKNGEHSLREFKQYLTYVEKNICEYINNKNNEQKTFLKDEVSKIKQQIHLPSTLSNTISPTIDNNLNPQTNLLPNFHKPKTHNPTSSQQSPPDNQTNLTSIQQFYQQIKFLYSIWNQPSNNIQPTHQQLYTWINNINHEYHPNKTNPSSKSQYFNTQQSSPLQSTNPPTPNNQQQQITQQSPYKLPQKISSKQTIWSQPYTFYQITHQQNKDNKNITKHNIRQENSSQCILPNEQNSQLYILQPKLSLHYRPTTKKKFKPSSKNQPNTKLNKKSIITTQQRKQKPLNGRSTTSKLKQYHQQKTNKRFTHRTQDNYQQNTNQQPTNKKLHKITNNKKTQPTPTNQPHFQIKPHSKTRNLHFASSPKITTTATLLSLHHQQNQINDPPPFPHPIIQI